MASKIVHILFDVLRRNGVRQIVCSPGSRNAELILECSAQKEIKKTIVIDERVAGFVALGMSQVSKQPVALVCTSGSAMLNYAPALSEAYYQGLPLIVISADRPEEWIDQDDSQTIRQFGALQNIVKASYDIHTENVAQDYQWYINRIANEGINIALAEKPGPVHFNVHLAGKLRSDTLSDNEERKIVVFDGNGRLNEKELEDLVARAVGKKIMIVCGFGLPDNRLQKIISRIQTLPSVCILAETISNLHLDSHCYFIDRVLFRIRKDEINKLRPDIVISLGGALVSRKLKEFLRNNPPEEHWSLSHTDNLVDCFQALTLKLNIDSAWFLGSFFYKLNKMSRKDPTLCIDYQYRWIKKYEECRVATDTILEKSPWSDLKAHGEVFKNIPEKANLFLSNGTSIRYAQILPSVIPHASYSNRGVSGIEGSLSAALGGSLIYKGLTVLVSGDISLTYDIGAIASGIAGRNVRVIVFSNGGGDIFRFIGMTSSLPEREKYFCIEPHTPFKRIAEAYGWEYREADDMKSLTDALRDFFGKSESPRLLNIITSSSDNSKILKEFLNIK